MYSGYQKGPIYQAAPLYDGWLTILLGVIVLSLLGVGIYLVDLDISGTWTMLGAAAFIALLMYFIMPRKYQIFEDKIRIALGGQFAVNIPFSNIARVSPASGSKSYVYSGIRLATSSRNVVEIIRKRGGGVVISPRNRDIFLEQFNQAFATYNRIRPPLK